MYIYYLLFIIYCLLFIIIDYCLLIIVYYYKKEALIRQEKTKIEGVRGWVYCRSEFAVLTAVATPQRAYRPTVNAAFAALCVYVSSTIPAFSQTASHK